MARLVSGVYQQCHGAGAILVSETLFNQELLEQLRSSAWEKSRQDKSRQDKSRTYLQWLDLLCSKYGFTYPSLKKHIEELEAAVLAKSLAELFAVENAMWEKRLANSRVWGIAPALADQTWPLPVEDSTHVPWPTSFIECRLFSLAEAPPCRTLSGPIFRMDDQEMLFDGEELRLCHDQSLLMGFILISRETQCGAIVECSLQDLEGIMGCPMPDLGMPISYMEIERTLWRLSNCRLTFPEYGFDGPILAYADARRAPDHFRFAFNPAFANFYYPILKIFGAIFK